MLQNFIICRSSSDPLIVMHMTPCRGRRALSVPNSTQITLGLQHGSALPCLADTTSGRGLSRAFQRAILRGDGTPGRPPTGSRAAPAPAATRHTSTVAGGVPAPSLPTLASPRKARPCMRHDVPRAREVRGGRCAPRCVLHAAFNCMHCDRRATECACLCKDADARGTTVGVGRT